MLRGGRAELVFPPLLLALWPSLHCKCEQLYDEYQEHETDDREHDDENDDRNTEDNISVAKSGGKKTILLLLVFRSSITVYYPITEQLLLDTLVSARALPVVVVRHQARLLEGGHNQLQLLPCLS